MNADIKNQINKSIELKKKALEDLLSNNPKQKKIYTVQDAHKSSEVDKLFSELVEKVSLKQFKQAEALRKKIFKINSMATNEIIRSGILIENEKIKFRIAKPLKVLKQSEKAFSDSENINYTSLENTKSTETKCLANKSVTFPENWDELYKTMEFDEVSIFTKALKPLPAKSSKTLIKQGMLNNYLFFINSGHVKVIGVTNGVISTDKTLNPGDVVGEDVFFSNTPSPVSAIAAKGAKIDYIKKADLYQLCSVYPSIGESLFNYCNKKGKTTATLYTEGLNQRSFKRISTSGTADLQLLKTGKRNLGKPFTSKVLDISIGGISLEINKIKPELARKLINMPTNIFLNLNKFESPIFCTGDITGVHRKSHKSYTLHLKWQKANEKLAKTIDWLTHH